MLVPKPRWLPGSGATNSPKNLMSVISGVLGVVPREVGDTPGLGLTG